jgi:uncharacterized protein (TIGR00369 family)
MLDMILSSAMASSLDDKQTPLATVEMKVSYISAAAIPAFVGEARVIHKGRSLVFAEGKLVDANGSLVATASGTYRISTESN